MQVTPSQSIINLRRKYFLWAAAIIFTLSTGYALYQPTHPDSWHAHNFLDKFIYPQESNAFLRQPSINKSINSITSVDNFLWAVGNGGLILHSADGGNCWTPQGPWVETINDPSCTHTKKGLNRVFSNLSTSISSNTVLESLISPANAADSPAFKKKVKSSIVQEIVKGEFTEGLDSKSELKTKAAPKAQEFTSTRPLNTTQSTPVKTKNKPTKTPKTPTLVTGKDALNTIQFELEKKDRISKDPKKQPVNPADKIPSLYDVAFFDKEHGIAIGSEGLILITDNSGYSWSANKKENLNFSDSIVIIGKDQAIIFGKSSAFLLTRDAGKTWSSFKNKENENQLSAIEHIAVTSNNKRIAVGRNGIILGSNDGENTWYSVESETNNWLTSVAISHNNQVIAVGEKGTILLSRDDGDTWHPVESGTNDFLKAVTFTSNNRIIVAGQNGTLLSSDDDGDTWHPVESGTNNWLNTATFTSNNRIIIAGQNGTLLSSDDNGNTWSSLNSRARDRLFSVAKNTNNQAIAVGKNGTMLRSNISGDSWSTLNSNTTQRLHAIAINTNNQAIAVGNNGTVLHSTNGGNSWSSIDNGVHNNLLSVAFINNNEAIGVGNDGTMLRTDDTGKSWSLVTSETKKDLYAIAVNNKKQAIVVGTSGVILRSDGAGKSWTTVKSGLNKVLHAVAINNDLAIAVGSGGTILRSGDAGKSWFSVDANTRDRLHAIAISNTNAIAVGQNGTIIRSIDSGASWTPVDSGTNDRLFSIVFIHKNNAITVGENGLILHSSNGGLSWSQVNHYTVNIATWWYLAVFLSGALLLLAIWPRLERNNEDGIEGIAASDKPLQPGDIDALNLTSISTDITEFLSNTKTTAPLTMAITGPWGCGKSSLMNLVRAELKIKGFSPVWFNAWHHQKGEQLLASLFAHIKQQAIPSWFSFDGLWFRLKLACIRGRRHWFIFAIMLCLLFFTLSLNKQAIANSLLQLSLLSNPEDWWSTWGAWMPNIQLFTHSGDTLQILASLFGIGTPLVALLHSVRGFGINPKRLVSIDHGRETNKAYDPGARARFSTEFKDVTRALGNNKMVIFIDDLDRCTQENLIDILENINFISCSGDCFLILGMAPKYIEACVANAYETLAKNIAEKEKYDNKSLSIGREKKYKFSFAHNYLEKMINITVAIPKMQYNNISQLIKINSQDTKKKNLSSFYKTTTEYLYKKINLLIPIVFIIFAMGAGWEYGRNILPAPQKLPNPVYDLWPADKETLLALSQTLPLNTVTRNLLLEKYNGEKADSLHNFSIVLQADKIQLEKGIKIGSIGEEKDKAIMLLKLNAEHKSSIIDQTTSQDKKSSITQEIPIESANGIGAEFRQGAIESSPRLSMLRLLLGVLIFLSFTLYLFNKNKVKYAKDTDSFKKALSNWTPWIQLKHETPRAIKRFLNHLRFLSIRNNNELEESVLVAMATIYFYNEEWLLDDDKFNKLMNKKLPELLATEYKSIGQDTAQQDKINTLTQRLQQVLDSSNIDDISSKRLEAINILKGAMFVNA